MISGTRLVPGKRAISYIKAVGASAKPVSWARVSSFRSRILPLAKRMFDHADEPAILTRPR
jgi:hypothetical protein